MFIIDYLVIIASSCDYLYIYDRPATIITCNTMYPVSIHVCNTNLLDLHYWLFLLIMFRLQWNLGIRDTLGTVQNCPEF